MYMYVWLSKVVFYIMCSGRSRGGAPCPPPPPLFWVKKKKIAKGRNAGQASKFPSPLEV